MKKRFVLLCLFIFALLFFFPKQSGHGGNVPITEINHCTCYGFSRDVNVHQTNVIDTVCYGWVGSCEGVLDCKGEQCWHEEKGCMCPGTDFWTEAQGPCEAYDGLKNCVCTHNECSGLQAIGG